MRFQPLLMPLQPRLPRPGTLEIVTDLKVQPAQRLGFDLDEVTVLERVEAAVIGSQRQDITRLKRMDRANPFDAAGNLMRHVAGVVVLHQRAIIPQSDLEVVRVLYLVGRDEKWAHGPEAVARLHLIERVAGGRQTARRSIDEVHVAKDIFHRT